MNLDGKLKVGCVFGVGCSLGGFAMRIGARAMSKPESASWPSGSWDVTDWAFWQRAWADVGLALLAFGLAVLAITFHHWLRSASAKA